MAVAKGGDPMTMTPSLFVNTVLEAFAFLARDHGYWVALKSLDGRESGVVLRNRTTGIEVIWEAGSPPWVCVSQIGDPDAEYSPEERYDLGFILQERSPETLKRVTRLSEVDADPGPVVRALADALRENASDLIRGDFTIFKSLERKAKTELLRREKEFYGD